jgi:dihydroflavonol-4-reductase
MRAFVTGSTGLLGINLVRILHQAGHEVWALARSKEKAQQTLGDMAARIVVGDIRKVAEFAPYLKGVDVVFHTSGLPVTRPELADWISSDALERSLSALAI